MVGCLSFSNLKQILFSEKAGILRFAHRPGVVKEFSLCSSENDCFDHQEEKQVGWGSSWPFLSVTRRISTLHVDFFFFLIENCCSQAVVVAGGPCNGSFYSSSTLWPVEVFKKMPRALRRDSNTPLTFPLVVPLPLGFFPHLFLLASFHFCYKGPSLKSNHRPKSWF